jgi:hypothetical protein
MAQVISFAKVKLNSPVHVYDRQMADPRELSIGQITGGVPGGWLLQELTRALYK